METQRDDFTVLPNHTKHTSIASVRTIYAFEFLILFFFSNATFVHILFTIEKENNKKRNNSNRHIFAVNTKIYVMIYISSVHLNVCTYSLHYSLLNVPSIAYAIIFTPLAFLRLLFLFILLATFE